MTRPAIRPWCAVARFPGLDPFLLGTVSLPAEARHDQIEAALRDLGAKVLPPGFAIEDLRCGALFFQEATP